MRVVRLDGRPADPGAPGLAPDDPLARAGDGLIETMRAGGGRVFRLAAHLDRMERAAAALAMRGLPTRAACLREVAEAVAAAGDGDLRVRLCVSTRPTLWVEATPVPPLPAAPAGLRAVALPGAWVPGNAAAEHKTASRAAWAAADRRAAAAGADAALLVDRRGRMGEATVASVLTLLGSGWVTAPVRGLLPGVGRAAVMELVPVAEHAPGRREWREAREMVLVSAAGGVRPVVAVDGLPVAGGAPGPEGRALARAYRALVARETGGGPAP